MKNSLFVVLLAFSLPAISQKDGKNMAKINLSAFAFKSFNVQYERQAGSKITVALGYSIIPFSSLAFKSAIKNQIDNPLVRISDFRLGTSIFTPEVRFYFGKRGAFHGFYLAPYARIGSYKIEGPVQYFDFNNKQQSAVFNGKINTFTGGLLVGSSWQLSKSFYLDWWIAGAGFGGAGSNLKAVTQLSTSDQESLKSTLDGISIAGTKLKSDVNSNGATVTTSGNMIGVRGFGINVGIRF